MAEGGEVVDPEHGGGADQDLTAPQPFVSIVFHGTRFDGAAIPVEALPELAAYREAIVVAAKGLFRARHAGRRRVPKGFESSIQLSLVGRIQPGSAIAEIRRTPALEDPDMVPLVLGTDEVDAAIELIERWFVALDEQEALPAELQAADQASLQRTLSRLGRHLLPDESIETRTLSRTSGVRYGQSSRRRLADLMGRDSFEVEYDNIAGFVTAVSAAGGMFTLDLGDLGTLEEIAFDPADHDPLSMALPEARPIPVVVSLTGSIEAAGNRLKSIDKVLSLTVVEEPGPAFQPPTAEEYHVALTELEDGAGPHLAAALEWFSRVLTPTIDSLGLAHPWLYPTEEDGLRAEWQIEDWRASVVYDAEEGLVRLFSTTIDADDFEEAEFPPEALDAIGVVRFLRREE